MGPGRDGGFAFEAACARAPRDDPCDPRRGKHDRGGSPLEHADQRERQVARLLERAPGCQPQPDLRDRKSTRLNSSHTVISYAVFCLKKKKNNTYRLQSEQKKNYTKKKQY